MNRYQLDSQGACTVTQHQVRPSDLDAHGHVNNARALEYLELGRWRWADDRFRVTSREVVPMVSEYAISYRDELFISALEIVTTLARSLAYSVVFRQEIAPISDSRRATRGQLAVMAMTTVCFVDHTQKRPIRVRDYARRCLLRREAPVLAVIPSE